MRCSATVGGAVDRGAFEAFVAQVLLPALALGDMVVMQDLSSHKAPGAASRPRARGGSLLFLPPYSPDLNPIEIAFAKLKQLMPSAAHPKVDRWTRCSGTCGGRSTWSLQPLRLHATG